MLQQNPQPQNKFPMGESFWSDEEWEKIAAELKTRHPDKVFSSYFSDVYSLQDFEDAADSVIAQERQRSFSSFQDVRRQLFHAFERLRGFKPRSTKDIPAGFVDAAGAVRWSPEEWDEVVVEFHRLNPGAFETRLRNIRLAEVNEAVKVLDLSRQRYFNITELFRKQALKTWDALPPEARNPSLQERAIVEFPSGPVMAPPKQKRDESSAMASAIQKAFVEPQPAKRIARKVKAFWKEKEWLAVAREMLRQNPHANYFTSSFPILDLPAIRAAQSVALPLEKRKKIVSNDSFRVGLIAAFAALKLEIDSQKMNDPIQKEEKISSLQTVPTSENLTEAQKRTAKARATLAAMPAERRREIAMKAAWARAESQRKKLSQDAVAEPSNSPVAIQNSPPPIQEAKPVPVAPKAEIDFMGKLLNAALPLMNVLVEEAVLHLTPGLIAGILPQLEKSLGGMIERAVAAHLPKMATLAYAPILRNATFGAEDREPEVVQESAVIAPGPLSKAELAQYLPVPKEKAKKPKIALLMPGGAQREQMRVAFPEYEFVFIDHGEGIREAGQNCVLFVAVDAYVNIGNRKNIRQHIPVEKLRYVDGGLSSIKRQINIWKAENK